MQRRLFKNVKHVKNNESKKLTIHASSSNSVIMAFAKVGNGSGWPIANNLRKLQIRSSSG
jgi:hypothetical protein